MSSKFLRRSLYILLALALLVAGALFTLDPLLESALREVVEGVEGSGHRVSFDKVKVNVFGGGLRVTGLVIEPNAPLTEGDSTVRFSLHADEVDLRHVDLRRLLQERVLIMRAFIIHAPKLEHSHRTRKLAVVLDEGPTASTSNDLPTIEIDSLAIIGATMRSIDRAGKTPSLNIAHMDFFFKNVSLKSTGGDLPLLDRSETRVDLYEISSDISDLYRYRMDSARVRFPEETAQFYGIQLEPKVGPKEYHELVEFRTDLIQMKVDSLRTDGFNLVAKMRDGAYRIRTVHVFGALFEVYNDKSIPEGPSVRKPLPAEALLNMGVTFSLDTLIAEGCEVRYNERTSRSSNYGALSFTGIDAQLTGLNNTKDAPEGDIHLHGTAQLSGHGRATLDLRTPRSTEVTDLKIYARLDGLQASIFNRMTDDLLQVKATAGVIHRFEMNMHGNDTRASGFVDMRYEDLSLKLDRSVKNAGLISFAANMVVRTNNMPGSKSYRQGRFTVLRRQDRSVFNYLWQGVKAGAMDVVLPQSVTNEMRRAKGKKRSNR